MAKPPSWNEIRANAQKFSARWADATDENADAQTFWNEFLAIFGVDRRRVATFEARAQRASTGGSGRIDLLWPGVLVAEHKSAGKDLATAEDQVLDYLVSLNDATAPGVIITSDFQHIRIRDLEGDNKPYTFPLEDLTSEIDRFGFIAGYRKREFSALEEEQANITAARLMGALYEQMAKNGYDGDDASVFLTRLLFLFFGDDTALWEKGLFSEYVATRTQPDGSDAGSQLTMLFQTLNQPEAKRPKALDELLARFPYVNGGLFERPLMIPAFDHEMRDELVRCCAFDWGSISPALFGGMFQAVKNKEARRALGEHYTTEKNILRVIEPLFLDDFRERFDNANTVRKLENLRIALGKYRFMDPACGCGNFLVIGYRELRRLELEILKRRFELEGIRQTSLDVTLDLKVSPQQFYGIEIEEWPARIAEVAMFLVDHQSNLELAAEFGSAPDRLPIEITATIVHGHANGNALRINWADLLEPSDNVYVFGNPPFVGMNRMTDSQKDDRKHVFETIKDKGLRSGRLDYVLAWYAKAIEYMDGTTARAAFVSTNSVTQGEQARTMAPLLDRHGFEIDFAHRTFKWTSEAPDAAVVHVVIIGFSQGGQANKKHIYDYLKLDGEPVVADASYVNFYLVDYSGPVPTKRKEPFLTGLPNASKGSQPTDGGFLTVEIEDYDEVMKDPIASAYVRPYRQSTEMIYDYDRWCLWLVGASPGELRSSPVIHHRLQQVKESRLNSKTPAVRANTTPALFTQRRQPSVRYFALPEVSSVNREYIPSRFYEPEVIAGNKLICLSDPPMWLVAFFQSQMFTIWVKMFAGRLKSDPSISPSTSYFTFPFVEPSDLQKEQLTKVTQEVLDARLNHPTDSLADLYDPLAMPADVRAAHVSVDRIVDGLYGLKKASEGRRLSALLARFAVLESVGTLPSA